DAEDERRHAAEDRAIEQPLHAHGGVGDELARAQHLDHRPHDARGSRKEPGVDEAEAGTKLPQNEKGQRRNHVQQPIARARGHFRGGLRPRRNRLHAHDFISSSCCRARCTSSRRLDQMSAISAPYCCIFCTSLMLRGRAGGTGTNIFTFPGCAVITMMRSPRNTASSTEWVMNTTVFLCSSQMWSNSSCSRSLFCASSAENGSSISRISG